MTLQEVRLENFKCFQNLKLSCSLLTVLTGYNAAGKSSSVQPLLLLSQALRRGGAVKNLDLNGPLVKLGSVGEVLATNALKRAITFGFKMDDVALEWKFKASEAAGSSALELVSLSLSAEQNESLISNEMTWPGDFGQKPSLDVIQQIRNVIYLSATRAGTSEVFPQPDDTTVNADVGFFGEFAAWWYAKFADEEVDPLRRHANESGFTLRRQLDAYLDDLFPGSQANAELIVRTQLARLGFRSNEQSDWMRPSNIGYGLTYAFPILVSLLLASPGQIVIIDSPEAHLHPRGQSRMGYLLAKFAQSGVQIIVESHSDHVLNGIRLAVRAAVIAPSKVFIHFFGKIGVQAVPTALVVDSNGALSEWPEGFFDQAELDLTTLAGLG